jgi:hypothetical protein
MFNRLTPPPRLLHPTLPPLSNPLPTPLPPPSTTSTLPSPPPPLSPFPRDPAPPPPRPPRPPCTSLGTPSLSWTVRRVSSAPTTRGEGS